MGLNQLHRSEIFAEKHENSMIKALSGRPVSNAKFNRTIMLKNSFLKIAGFCFKIGA